MSSRDSPSKIGSVLGQTGLLPNEQTGKRVQHIAHVPARGPAPSFFGSGLRSEPCCAHDIAVSEAHIDGAALPAGCGRTWNIRLPGDGRGRYSRRTRVCPVVRLMISTRARRIQGSRNRVAILFDLGVERCAGQRQARARCCSPSGARLPQQAGLWKHHGGQECRRAKTNAQLHARKPHSLLHGLIRTGSNSMQRFTVLQRLADRRQPAHLCRNPRNAGGLRHKSPLEIWRSPHGKDSASAASWNASCAPERPSL